MCTCQILLAGPLYFCDLARVHQLLIYTVPRLPMLALTPRSTPCKLTVKTSNTSRWLQFKQVPPNSWLVIETRLVLSKHCQLAISNVFLYMQSVLFRIHYKTRLLFVFSKIADLEDVRSQQLHIISVSYHPIILFFPISKLFFFSNPTLYLAPLWADFMDIRTALLLVSLF